jgi:hypothetical protein
MGWIDLAQDRDNWHALGRTVLHGVSVHGSAWVISKQ